MIRRAGTPFVAASYTIINYASDQLIESGDNRGSVGGN